MPPRPRPEPSEALRSTPAGTPGLSNPLVTVAIPPELAFLPDAPTRPLDLDAFEMWARTGEGDPWRAR